MTKKELEHVKKVLEHIKPDANTNMVRGHVQLAIAYVNKDLGFRAAQRDNMKNMYENDDIPF